MKQLLNEDKESTDNYLQKGLPLMSSAKPTRAVLADARTLFDRARQSERQSTEPA